MNQNPHSWSILAVPLSVLLVAGCASRGARPGSSEAPGKDGTEATEATDERSSPRESDAPAVQTRKATPPSGEWLTDEEGRRYFTREIPKYEGYYRWVSEDRIRLSNGMAYDVAEERPESFVVKVYDVAERQPPVTPEGDEQVTVGELREQVDLPERELRGLIPVDEGLPRSGQWRQGFEIADLNGDGHPDIVHGPARKGRGEPVVFLGDGEGSWRRWREARFEGPALDYGDVAVADFNGDGRLDVAFAVHLRGLQVFVAEGDGVFTTWSEGLDYQVPGEGTVASFSSRAIDAIDWNGDAHPDLVALGEGPRIRAAGGRGENAQFFDAASGPVVFVNQGDGTWTSISPEEEAAENYFGDDLAVADLDADGDEDFAIASATVGIKRIVRWNDDDGADWSVGRIEALPAAALVRSVDAADFDADGSVDLVVGLQRRVGAEWASEVDVLFSRDDGEWSRETLLVEPGSGGIWSVAAGDVDGDGAIDVVAGDGDGGVHLFLGTEDGGFARVSHGELETVEKGCRAYHAAIEDLDADGHGEIVVAFAGESGSEILFGDEPRCPHGGAIRVWSIEE